MTQTRNRVLFRMITDRYVTRKEWNIIHANFLCVTYDPYGAWLPNTRRIRKLIRAIEKRIEG